MKIFLIAILTIFCISCKEEKSKPNPRPPHPDSIGVGTKDYLNGEKQALIDLRANSANLYLVEFMRLDSLEFERMKKDFYEKFQLRLEIEIDSLTMSYIDGYNNQVGAAFRQKYGVGIKSTIHDWIEQQ